MPSAICLPRLRIQDVDCSEAGTSIVTPTWTHNDQPNSKDRSGCVRPWIGRETMTRPEVAARGLIKLGLPRSDRLVAKNAASGWSDAANGQNGTRRAADDLLR
jgi:hypothetical protein